MISQNKSRSMNTRELRTCCDVGSRYEADTTCSNRSIFRAFPRH
jgi:hypothetical protein